MRRALVAGNWKMNKTIDEARTLARDVAEGVAGEKPSGVDVLLGPPYLALPAVAEAVSGSAVGVAGQNCSHHPDGAYTGEVSVSMLRDAGATHVILGHSERRELMGEGDGLIARKAQAASAGGLTPIICLGEPFTTRKAGKTLERIAHQIEHSIQGAFASPPPGGVHRRVRTRMGHRHGPHGHARTGPGGARVHPRAARRHFWLGMRAGNAYLIRWQRKTG